MNVQQINNSGKDIRVVIITAAVLSILAICGWALSMAFQYRWGSMNHEKVPLGRRLSTIMWLVRNGKIWWMISSGALIRLMTDGRYGFSGEAVPCHFEGRPTFYIETFYINLVYL